MADTVKTIGTAADYADPILWAAGQGGVNDGNRQVGEMINDISINALFRPNQTFVNGGLLRGNVTLTGEVGVGITFTNSAASRFCLSPNPVVEFQDFWCSNGGTSHSSTFQNISGNDFLRVISTDVATGGTITAVADTTTTTATNCVLYNVVQGNSAVSGSVTVNNCVVLERMVVRANNLLTFFNSISLANDWYLGRPTDSGAESLVNYCYIKENANANEFGPGSSNNTINTDSTSDLVNVGAGDYRTGSAAPQATGNGSGGLIGAFLEVSSGNTLTADSGAYLYTGTDATLTYTPLGAFTLIADSGTYLYTGNDADLLTSRILQADSGAYAYTGNNAELLRDLNLNAETGGYSYLGQDVTLTFTPAGTFILTADSGTYNYTGQDINFNRNRVIIASSGNYTYNGTDIQIILPGQIWTDKPSVSTNWTNQTKVTTIWTDK